MKRLVIGCVAAVALCALGVLGFAAPSGANTSCHIMNPQAGTAIRFCGINTTIIGAQFKGFTTWAFANTLLGAEGPSTGNISGTVIDSADDGSCANVNVNHLEPSGYRSWHHTFSACGKGAAVNFQYGINGEESTHFGTGTWKVTLTTANLSTLLWTQSVTQNYHT